MAAFFPQKKVHLGILAGLEQLLEKTGQIAGVAGVHIHIQRGPNYIKEIFLSQRGGEVTPVL